MLAILKPLVLTSLKSEKFKKFVVELQKYAAIVIPSLYDTILLFLEITKKCNKLLK